LHVLDLDQPDLADLPVLLGGALEPGDTVVLMGAGDVATIWDGIADQLGEVS